MGKNLLSRCRGNFRISRDFRRSLPQCFRAPLETDSGWHIVGRLALLVSVFGLVPLLFVVGGLALARINRRQLLALVATTIGMLLLIGVGALVLFEMGPFIANLVAVGLVGLAGLGGTPEAPAQLEFPVGIPDDRRRRCTV